MVSRAESERLALTWPLAPGELVALVCLLAADVERLNAPAQAEANYIGAIARLGLALGSSPGPVMDVLVAASDAPPSPSALRRDLTAAGPPSHERPERPRRRGRHRVVRLPGGRRTLAVAAAALAAGLVLLVALATASPSSSRSSLGGVSGPTPPDGASSRPTVSVTPAHVSHPPIITAARSELVRSWRAQLRWMAARGLRPVPAQLRIVHLSSPAAPDTTATRCVIESLSSYRIVDRNGRTIARVAAHQRVVPFVSEGGRWQAMRAAAVSSRFSRGRCGR